MSEALRLERITRRCGATLANDHVDLTVLTGEIHAVIGENGAGKSTLLHIAAGLHPPDSGSITLFGTHYPTLTSAQAIAAGVGLVQQHFALIPALTVAENLVLGAEPRRGPFFSHDAARARVLALAQSLGFSLNPDALVSTLSMGQQQRLEILKLLHREARLLILDEPTAVLAPQECDELFSVLRRLRAQGHAVVLVTHKLREVMALSDRVTVLRRGRKIETLNTAQTDIPTLTRLMVEGSAAQAALAQLTEGGLAEGKTHSSSNTPAPQAVVLSVRGLRVRDARGHWLLHPTSFELHAGEVLGVAGVIGNGQTELVEALAGLRSYEGEIHLKGQRLDGVSAAERLRQGLAHIPEDRQAHGLVLGMTVAENFGLGRLAQLSRWGWLQRLGLVQAAQQGIQQLDIRPPDPDGLAQQLSGGNQQKIVVARELQRQPACLLAAQPTRGVDIGAMAILHEQLVQARTRGTAILLISADLNELRSLSDRIMVLYQGKMVGILSRSEAEEARLGTLMIGGAGHEPGQ